MKTVWTYNEYRATLLKNGKFFAFVTPDGANAISGQAADELLNSLNGKKENKRKKLSNSH